MSSNNILILNATTGNYDLIIYEPLPHNVHWHGSKSWENALENKYTFVLGDHNSPPSKNKIEEYARFFLKKWVSSID